MAKQKSIYKEPLYAVRSIRDLRDMIQQSVKLYGDGKAYLVKDPVALREADPHCPPEDDSIVRHKRPYKGITFKQFYADTQAFGSALMTCGVPVGCRVAILAETRYEWYVSYLAVVNGYGVVVPLDKELPEREILGLLERSEADILIYSKEKGNAVEAIRNKLTGIKRYICMDWLKGSDDAFFWDMLAEGDEIWRSGEHDYERLPIDPEVMSVLLFTSGTTARSKAVMLSHKNICSNLMAMCSMIYLDEQDVCLSVLPLHHTYECTCGYLCPLYRGSTVAVCEGLRYISQDMKECHATIVMVVPLMLEAIYRQTMRKVHADALTNRRFSLEISLSRVLRKVGIDLRSKIFAEVAESFGGKLHLMIVGGAPIEAKLLKNLQDIGLHAVQGYGLTECAPILAVNRDIYYNNSAAGLPLPGVDIKIINADKNGIGEICGRGDNVMIGYYQNEKASRAAIDAEGFYHTGDLGYLDENGFVIITGRKSNVIVTKNGKNIFPEELEFVLSRDEHIAESVVYGAADADGDVTICCQIYPNYELFTKENAGVKLSDEEILEKIEAIVKTLNKHLTPFKRIRKVSVRNHEFEKTTGKIIRRSSLER